MSFIYYYLIWINFCICLSSSVYWGLDCCFLFSGIQTEPFLPAFSGLFREIKTVTSFSGDGWDRLREIWYTMTENYPSSPNQCRTLWSSQIVFLSSSVESWISSDRSRVGFTPPNVSSAVIISWLETWNCTDLLSSLQRNGSGVWTSFERLQVPDMIISRGFSFYLWGLVEIEFLMVNRRAFLVP